MLIKAMEEQIKIMKRTWELVDCFPGKDIFGPKWA